MKVISLLLLSVIPFVSYAEDLDSLVDNAIEKMESGNLDESKSILEKVLVISPDHYEANYEMAYLLTMNRQYEEALRFLAIIKNSVKKNDRYYQLLGSVYDFIGDSEKAIYSYKEGLGHFPESGRLHVELGMMYHKSNDLMKALELYENGIIADPMFPSNYFYAGLVLMNSSEPVWGLMYGEIFMNLEPHTDRSKTMSKYMYEVLTSNTTITDSDFTSNLTKDSSVGFNQKSMKLEMSFPLLYQTCYNAGGRQALEDGYDSLELYSLGKIHNYQIEHGKTYYKPDFYNPLYNYLLKIQSAGFIEEYCMLLYKGGCPTDYVGWLTMNQERFKAFMEWREKNKLNLSQSNLFSRLTCDPIELN